MLPYFKRAEDNQRFADDYHGYGGPLGVSMPGHRRCRSARPSSAPAQELGIPFNPDFNGAQQDGVGYYQLTQHDAARSSAVDRLSRSRSRARKNLTVRTDAR